MAEIDCKPAGIEEAIEQARSLLKLLRWLLPADGFDALVPLSSHIRAANALVGEFQRTQRSLAPYLNQIESATDSLVEVCKLADPTAAGAVLRLADQCCVRLKSAALVAGKTDELASLTFDRVDWPHLVNALEAGEVISNIDYERLDAQLRREAIETNKAILESRKGKGPEGPAEATHSDDFRSINWYGTEYQFTTNQALCIAVLWEHYERKARTVSGSTILERADISQGRLDLVFRGNKAWGELIVPGNTKGSYKLRLPSEPSISAGKGVAS